MLVSATEMLKKARDGHYAVGQFNINNLEWTKAVLLTAQELNSPVILGVSEGAGKYMTGYKTVAAMVKAMVETLNITVPVALHLDHGRNFESCKAAIAGGYTSVMIDGSSLPFEENIEITREVVKYAHERGVSVEAELGVLAGVEDHVFSAGSTYTNPLDAVEFIKKTKVDALAISYGTMHGANKGKGAKLRKEIAIATKECLLHEGIFCAL